jgi:ATP synthase protein I|tara:strand:- start:494 stop:949 length:456 start_codon:yes stop_codon:yes gene_type:complete
VFFTDVLGVGLNKKPIKKVRFVTNLKAPPVYKVIVAQLVATSFIALIFLFLSGSVVAYSVLLGGLISVFSNSYFAMQAFKYRGARNADKVVRSFIRGELGKIGITLVLFALSFTLITNLNELALILGFIATHFVGVMMSGLISYSPTGNKT